MDADPRAVEAGRRGWALPARRCIKITIPFHRATEALECAARTARAGRRRTRAEEVGGRKKNTGSKQARV